MGSVCICDSSLGAIEMEREGEKEREKERESGQNIFRSSPDVSIWSVNARSMGLP